MPTSMNRLSPPKNGVSAGEGDAVADHHPQHGHEAGDREALHYGGQHVHLADHAAVEQRQPRDRHHQHERGRGQHPGGVAGVELDRLGGSGGGSRRRGGLRQRRGGQRQQRGADQHRLSMATKHSHILLPAFSETLAGPRPLRPRRNPAYPETKNRAKCSGRGIRRRGRASRRELRPAVHPFRRPPRRRGGGRDTQAARQYCLLIRQFVAASSGTAITDLTRHALRGTRMGHDRSPGR